MASKNARRKPRRPSARVAAKLRERQRQNRRRAVVTAAALAVILAIVAVLLGPVLGSKTTTTSTSSVSTSAPTTTVAMPSARGKPCVAVSDPLPNGAPAVPVQTGPPPTALVKKDLEVGTGAVVKANATLAVDYIGVSCSTGKIFDSSYSRGQSASFGLKDVIPGWQQGIPGMKVGGVRLLGIPPQDAYGSQGRPPTIAPDETLWFVVHVVSAK